MKKRGKKDGRKVSEVSETFKTTSIISIDYKVNLRGEKRGKAQKNKQQLKGFQMMKFIQVNIKKHKKTQEK